MEQDIFLDMFFAFFFAVSENLFTFAAITGGTITATKGNNAPNSIGAGGFGTSTCGTVMFGTQTMYNGTNWTTTPTSGSTYGGLSLTISQTTYANDTWTLTPVTP